MGCATSLVKYLVFLFNLICALAGLALLIIGVLFKLSIDDYTEVIKNEEENLALAPILLIVIGSIIFVIAFFGCCGAIRESTCMLTTYAIVLLILFILQLAIGIYAFLQFKDDSKEFRNVLTRELQHATQEYYTNNGTREAMDLLQENLDCCGSTGPDDYNSDNLPLTCCKGHLDPCRKGDSYEAGCANELFKFLKGSVKLIGIIAVSIAATELIAAIFALCLTSSIRNQERRGAYA